VWKRREEEEIENARGGREEVERERARSAK